MKFLKLSSSTTKYRKKKTTSSTANFGNKQNIFVVEWLKWSIFSKIATNNLTDHKYHPQGIKTLQCE